LLSRVHIAKRFLALSAGPWLPKFASLDRVIG
jgi:hypothetical protein